MSITLILVAVAVVTTFALYSVAAHPTTAEVSLAGEFTAVGLGDPAVETMAAYPRTPELEQACPEWQMAPVTDLTIAEDYLDSLEARGFTERELVVLGNSTFAVRWR